MVEAIKTGFPQREIADAAFIYQREVDSKQRIVVGVNDYRVADDELTELHRPDPGAERRQRERLERTHADRDATAVEAALRSLRQAAATDANLMPAIVDAARARVSEGEMVAALQQVFGTYTEQPQF
jgi:methylmalonyl-CoA mutase N-terminal domain/subunit